MTWMGSWRERAGRIILDPHDPDGVPIDTPRDRRWLWRIEATLTTGATTDQQRLLARDLREYLRETCEHHWRPYSGDEHVSAHAQCLWCNQVRWLDSEL
ncbi:hypothetical protein [Amycolatopsis arida]|uniref:hypothetical protein n=1 Tax=Amycolatopsis arida TaxID=587909 RepID=UPI00106677EE|nr:hypothetical protein [Amycolatopsis arida]TDX84942.1 hypothetical protein CLV69_11726 [Amycolatopsis arida]